jgi:hypothetical protein
MVIEDDIKAAELETRKLEILQRQKDLGEKRRFGLASAAVLVTILGGLAAVLFQGIGFLTSTQDKENAEIAAASDFDFKGLELFVKEQDHLITCDPDESARNLKLFNDLFSKRVTAGFSEVVAYRSQKCIAQSQNSGAAEAEAKTKGAPLSTEEIAAAADVARYAAAALQASLLDASTAANAPARQKYRVFIQINSEADRIDAAALQAALNSKG